VDPRPALLLFARVPEEGRVKTRLAPVLTAAGANELYRAFLKDASRLYGANPDWRPVLRADPSAEVPSLVDLFPPPWHRRTQGPGDLGERLRRAFEDAFADGARRAVAVGADHPTLSNGALSQLLQALDSADAAVVPAEDGGYCAIGWAAQRFSAEAFRDVPWSSPAVLETTLERIRSAGHSCRLLPAHYDVDRPEDLDRLRRDLARRDPAAGDYPRATADCLAALEAAPARGGR
jgi:rSAM/selenodomain-associated transferase 1